MEPPSSRTHHQVSLGKFTSAQSYLGWLSLDSDVEENIERGAVKETLSLMGTGSSAPFTNRTHRGQTICRYREVCGLHGTVHDALHHFMCKVMVF